MKTRFSFKNHLSHTFFIYIAAIAVTSLGCSYGIMLKTNPKDFEKFSIFTEASFINETSFRNQMNDVLPEDKIINLYYADVNDRSYSTYFSSFGLNSDICLLSKATLDKFESIQFLNLKDTKWDLTENYYFETYSIGVKCHSKDGTELNSYFTFGADDYYLLILKNSVHLKGITSGKTDQTNRVLEYLLSL